MASKVGLASVSYGIGVQNRYSAFLDDEDGFGLSTVAVPGAAKRQNDSSAVKQKNTAGGTQKLSNSQNQKANGRQSDSKVKQDGQSKGFNQLDGQKQMKADIKRGQPQRTSTNNASSRQVNSNNKHVNQEGITANNKLTRNQYNNNHQTQASHPSGHNKENYESNKPFRNNQRFNGRGRQYHYDDNNKRGQTNHVADGQLNGSTIETGPQSIEEEKQRRQQKRALDLKFKDPEKKEARRNQQSSGDLVDQQSGPDNTEDLHDQSGALGANRGQRFRRDGGRNQDGEADRGFKGSRGGRVRRNQEGEFSNGEPRRDGQFIRPNQRNGERPPRNRNGFGTGSRGSRGSRGAGGDERNQRPIPNFSDKLDFPSLIS